MGRGNVGRAASDAAAWAVYQRGRRSRARSKRIEGGAMR